MNAFLLNLYCNASDYDEFFEGYNQIIWRGMPILLKIVINHIMQQTLCGQSPNAARKTNDSSSMFKLQMIKSQKSQTLAFKSQGCPTCLIRYEKTFK